MMQATQATRILTALLPRPGFSPLDDMDSTERVSLLERLRLALGRLPEWAKDYLIPDAEDLHKALEAVTWHRVPAWLARSLRGAQLAKGAGHKYVKRVPTGKFTKTGKQRYRYFYAVHHGAGVIGHKDELKQGAAFKLSHDGKDGHFHIVGVDGDKLRIKHDETGHVAVVEKKALQAMLSEHHAEAIESARTKARETHEAAQKTGSAKQKARARAKATKIGAILPEEWGGEQTRRPKRPAISYDTRETAAAKRRKRQTAERIKEAQRNQRKPGAGKFLGEEREVIDPLEGNFASKQDREDVKKLLAVMRKESRAPAGLARERETINKLKRRRLVELVDGKMRLTDAGRDVLSQDEATPPPAPKTRAEFDKENPQHFSSLNEINTGDYVYMGRGKLGGKVLKVTLRGVTVAGLGTFPAKSLKRRPDSEQKRLFEASQKDAAPARKKPAPAPEKPKKTGVGPLESARKLLSDMAKTPTPQMKMVAVDWGAGKARGQGRRRGRMVMGAMSDAPRGKKFYPDNQATFGLNKEDAEEVGALEGLSFVAYAKARAMGLDHERAMVVVYASEEEQHATLKSVSTPGAQPSTAPTPATPPASKKATGAPAGFVKRKDRSGRRRWSHPKGFEVIDQGSRHTPKDERYSVVGPMLMPEGHRDVQPIGDFASLDEALRSAEKHMKKDEENTAALGATYKKERAAIRRRMLGKSHGLAWHRVPAWLAKALRGSLLVKGAGHKYVKRVPTGKFTKTGRPRYRYYYAVHHGAGVIGHKDELKQGAAFKLSHNGQDGHFHIIGVAGDKLRIRHDETGHEAVVEKSALQAMLREHHAEVIGQARERARKTHEDAQKFGSAKQKARARKRAEKIGVSLAEDEPKPKPKPKRIPKALRLKVGKFTGDPLMDGGRDADIFNQSGERVGLLTARYSTKDRPDSFRAQQPVIDSYEVTMYRQDDSGEHVTETFKVNDGDWRSALRDAKAYSHKAFADISGATGSTKPEPTPDTPPAEDAAPVPATGKHAGTVEKYGDMLANDSSLRPAAMANSLQNFALVFDRKLETLIIDRMGEDGDALALQFFEDADFKKRTTESLREQVYKRLRAEGSAPKPEPTPATPPAPAPKPEPTPATPPAPGGLSVAFSADDVSSELATSAHAGTSYRPEKRGQIHKDEYTAHMGALLEQASKLATPENKASLEAALEREKAGYLKRLNALLAAKSRVVSPLITGRSNFPVGRNQKRLDTEAKRLDEFLKYAQGAGQRIKKEFDPSASRVISSDDADAVTKLKAKIAKLEERQAKMKAANKIARSKNLTTEQKTSQLKALLGYGDETINNILNPDWGKPGFETYQLSNNNANIKRMKARVATLEREAARAPSEPVPFDGGEIVEDRDANRVQIHFEDRPDRAMIQKLKSSGFRWSPRNQAWQRQNTDAGRAAAQRVVGLMKGGAFSRMAGVVLW